MVNKLSSHPLRGSLRAFGGIKAYNAGLVRWMVNGQEDWTVEGGEKNKQPPKHGLWKSWVVSFKKGQFTGDLLFYLLVFVAVLFVCGVKLLMALVSWLSNG